MKNTPGNNTGNVTHTSSGAQIPQQAANQNTNSASQHASSQQNMKTAGNMNLNGMQSAQALNFR